MVASVRLVTRRGTMDLPSITSGVFRPARPSTKSEGNNSLASAKFKGQRPQEVDQIYSLEWAERHAFTLC